MVRERRASAKEAFLFMISHEVAAPDTTVCMTDSPFPVTRMIDLESDDATGCTSAGSDTVIRVPVLLGGMKILHVLL